MAVLSAVTFDERKVVMHAEVSQFAAAQQTLLVILPASLGTRSARSDGNEALW